MHDKKLTKLKEAALKATPGNWGEDWSENYPFYVDVKKPAPSLSKHDSERPTYWRREDAYFVLAFNRETVLELLDYISKIKEDLALATDALSSADRYFKAKEGIYDCDVNMCEASASYLVCKALNKILSK